MTANSTAGKPVHQISIFAKTQEPDKPIYRRYFVSDKTEDFSRSTASRTTKERIGTPEQIAAVAYRVTKNELRTKHNPPKPLDTL